MRINDHLSIYLAWPPVVFSVDRRWSPVVRSEHRFLVFRVVRWHSRTIVAGRSILVGIRYFGSAFSRAMSYSAMMQRRCAALVEQERQRAEAAAHRIVLLNEPKTKGGLILP
jgi:hypothetical protein